MMACFFDFDSTIVGQFLQTDPDIGYVVVDIDTKDDPHMFKEKLKSIKGSLRTRVLH